MQNIFAAGTDGLLHALALREAERQRQAELERQAQREQDRQFENDRAFRLQERQLDSVDQDRKARDADRKSGLEKAETEDRLFNDLVHAYQTETDPEKKAIHQSNLELRHKMKFDKPEVAKDDYHNVPHGTTVLKNGKEHFTSSERPRAETRERQAPKATPAQIQAAGRRAMLDAQNPLGRPEGMSQEAYAMALREQYLADLGVDPADYPVKTIARPPAPMAKPAASEAGVAAPNRGQDIALPMEGAPAPAPVAAPPRAASAPAPGMVRLASPDGKETRDVPEAQAAAFIAKGAKLVK